MISINANSGSCEDLLPENVFGKLTDNCPKKGQTCQKHIPETTPEKREIANKPDSHWAFFTFFFLPYLLLSIFLGFHHKGLWVEGGLVPVRFW